MSEDHIVPAGTRSVHPDISPLRRLMAEVVQYLRGQNIHGRSPSELLNWLRIEPGEEGSAFDENHLVWRDSKGENAGENVFQEKLQQMYDAEGRLGRAPDLMVLSIASDLVAQGEMAANFRRLKPAHHFAKALYNIENLAEGAQEPKNSSSILEEYTTVFLDNAIKHIVQ